MRARTKVISVIGFALVTWALIIAGFSVIWRRP